MQATPAQIALMNISPVFCYGQAGTDVATQVVGEFLSRPPWWTSSGFEDRGRIVESAGRGNPLSVFKVKKAFEMLRAEDPDSSLVGRKLFAMEAAIKKIARGKPNEVNQGLEEYAGLAGAKEVPMVNGGKIPVDAWLQWGFQFPWLEDYYLPAFSGSLGSVYVTTNVAGGFILASAHTSLRGSKRFQMRFFGFNGEMLGRRNPTSFTLDEPLVRVGKRDLTLLEYQRSLELYPSEYMFAEGANDQMLEMFAQGPKKGAGTDMLMKSAALLIEFRLNRGQDIGGGAIIADARSIDPLRLEPQRIFTVPAKAAAAQG